MTKKERLIVIIGLCLNCALWSRAILEREFFGIVIFGLFFMTGLWILYLDSENFS